MEKLIVQIPDLTCASCVPQIEQVIRQQEGVIWATVNFAAEKATILYDPIAFSPPRLMRAVGRLGYQILSGDKQCINSRGEFKTAKPFVQIQRWFQALCR